MNAASLSIDHLVFVVPSLKEAIDELEAKTGVRPAVGGRHLGLGTHNAFLSVGGGSYLELFAPDPEATVPLKSLIGVDGPKPRLSTFCCDAGAIGLDNLVDKFKTITEGPVRELLPTSIESGSRTNEADGTTISWRIAVDKHTVPSDDLPMGGMLPFYIDWGDCRDVRPATTAPPGCVLKKLTAYHPNPSALQHAVNEIGSGLEGLLTVVEGPEPKLVATLDTPNGEVQLS